MSFNVDRNKFPKDMYDYFDLKWPDDLWELGGQPIQAPLTNFVWHLDLPFWKAGPGHSFNLIPHNVLRNPDKHSMHYERILTANTDYPVIVSKFGSLLVILDGIHRLANLYLNQSNTITYRFVQKSKLLLIEPDKHKS